MTRLDTIEMLSFALKLLGRKTKKNVLVSAGQSTDKEKLLEAIKQLSSLPVNIFATHGTSIYLTENNIKNTEVHKIADGLEPNIKSLLKANRFDFIINILTGNDDYDETTDSRLIRTLAIQNGIPLITDSSVAILTIEELVRQHAEGGHRPSPTRHQPWNLKAEFLERVVKHGGFACYHAHFDKAYLISLDNLKLGMVDMQKKWELYKYLKESYTHEDLVTRISRGVETMIDQGVTYCRTMVDADSTSKLLPTKAALEVKEKYKDRIHFEFGIQPLEGMLDKNVRKIVIQACEMADFIGGLPSKDRPQPEKHLDYVMSLAKDLGKPLDVHVDQENNPYENETELLALKTIEYGMEGKVSAVHAISVAAKPPIEQERIIKLVKQAGMNVIVCPSAALSMKQLGMDAPLHNSIAPVARLLEAQVPIYLGVDNIYDLFMPVVDGDMWFECRLLMEATRFYDIEAVAEIACNKNGVIKP